MKRTGNSLTATNGSISLAPDTIGFRLPDEESRDILGSRAQALGMSAHELARHYTLQMLREEDQRQETHAALVEVFRAVAGLRSSLHLVAEAAITASGRYTKEQARAWMLENLS